MARTETFHNMGFRLTYPDVFDHTLGQVSPMAFGDTGDGVYFMMYSYIAVSAEDMNAMAGKSESGELSEEDKRKVADAMGSLLVVAGAAVQFCSDTTCMMGKTDAEGKMSEYCEA